MKRMALVYGAGVLFALGLGVGGMLDPKRVIGFLDVTGAWDPALMFVMLGAVLVHAPVAQWARRRTVRLSFADYRLALRHGVNGKLLGGAALFGAGWGLSGYCPGPGLVSLVTGNAGVLVFVLSMALGMWLAEHGQRFLARNPAAPLADAD